MKTIRRKPPQIPTTTSNHQTASILTHFALFPVLMDELSVSSRSSPSILALDLVLSYWRHGSSSFLLPFLHQYPPLSKTIPIRTLTFCYCFQLFATVLLTYYMYHKIDPAKGFLVYSESCNHQFWKLFILPQKKLHTY